VREEEISDAQNGKCRAEMMRRVLLENKAGGDMAIKAEMSPNTTYSGKSCLTATIHSGQGHALSSKLFCG
jgi:hypothetical protein